MSDITDQIDIAALIPLQPEAAIAHLRSKGLHIGWNWQDTLDEAHARSFTVAKMTDLSLLAETRKAVTEAMENGTGRRSFSRTIKPTLQEKGWWGKQIVVNPEGEQQEVQLGSPRRLKTIYHVNRRSAVMAAQYQRMLEAVQTHPYWQYWAILDGRTRPTHSAMHGTVYAHDDPFWQYHYPPNGFNCRCTVKALTKTAAEKAGIEQSDLQPHTQEIGINESTGEIYQAKRYATPIPADKAVAHGLSRTAQFAADAGFNASPTASHLFDQMWLDKAVEALGERRALAAIARDMAAEPRVRGFLAWVRTTQSLGKSQHRSYGVGVLSEQAVRKFREILPPERIGSEVVSYRDKLVAGRKVRRHEGAGNALDMVAYERIIRSFGQPDYQLWDTLNNHLLLIFKTETDKTIKLAVGMYKDGAEVISGFYIPIENILGGIKGGEYLEIK